jgi:hypothetical protein
LQPTQLAELDDYEIERRIVQQYEHATGIALDAFNSFVSNSVAIPNFNIHIREC